MIIPPETSIQVQERLELIVSTRNAQQRNCSSKQMLEIRGYQMEETGVFAEHNAVPCSALFDEKFPLGQGHFPKKSCKTHYSFCMKDASLRPL
jgi:hypothetical protein